MDTLEVPSQIPPGARLAQLRGEPAIMVDPAVSVQRGAELLRASGAAYLVVETGEQLVVLAAPDVLMAAGAGRRRPSRREAVSVLGEHAEIWLG